MILLDTNVLSALMQDKPDPAVRRWLDSVPAESVWLTTITVFEVRYGLERLPKSRRRQAFEHAFKVALEEKFEDRVLPFDTAAAEAAGVLSALQDRDGRHVDFRDVQIAGIATSRKAALATRNISGFEDLQIPLINPWST